MKINEVFGVGPAQNAERREDKDPSRVRAKVFPDGPEGEQSEEDPFNLELKITPRQVQQILLTESKYCGSDDNCTGCGCNTCCSSC